MTPSQLQKWVLSFQETNACCGSKLIAFLNSSSDSRSVWFLGVVLQVTIWTLQTASTSTNRPGAVASILIISRGVKNSEVGNSSGFNFLSCYIKRTKYKLNHLENNCIICNLGGKHCISCQKGKLLNSKQKLEIKNWKYKLKFETKTQNEALK